MILTSNKVFNKAIKKLPHKTRIVVAERIRLFKIDPLNPLLVNHALHGSMVGYRSINITGDYRAIFEEQEKDHFHFIDIGRHNQLYGK